MLGLKPIADTSPDSKPLKFYQKPHIRCRLRDQPAKAINPFTMVDPSGAYRIDGLMPGRYVLTFRQGGMMSGQHEVTINDGPNEFDFQIAAGVIEGRDVVGVARRRGELMAKAAAETLPLVAMITEVPGLAAHTTPLSETRDTA